ncbi:MAG: creatininase family protein [Candidatus Poribacteria bacterium]|nr:creatininase family protein [Candidatus Poribacteria bacterium]
MPTREVRWERMFPDELEAAFQQCPLAYLPYGLCEPHGPQNTLGMDALRAHAASCLAAAAHGGIVAPPFYWHIHEHGGYGTWAHRRVGDARPWLTAIPSWMFFKNMFYHIRAVDALGFHGAILFSGHSGPHHADVPKFLDMLQSHVDVRLFCIIGAGAPESRFPDDKGMGGHAGRGETSLLWATDADCVDLSRMPASDAPGPHFAMGDEVETSSRRAGEQMVADLVQLMGAKSKQLLEDYAKSQPKRAPLTFERVEAIWEAEIRPQLKTFASMQSGTESPPEDSRWYANWHVPDRG